MVSGAVSAASVAIGFDEVLAAVHALPVYKMWCHKDKVAELFVDLVEILQEIKDEVVVA